MPTMNIQQEIELTPEIAKEHLTAFSNATRSLKFPHEAGTFIKLDPNYAKMIGAIDGVPALVIAAPAGTPLGYIAFCKQSGITLGFAEKSQILGVW